MSRLVLIRHASTDEMNTVLCGRKLGIHLNQEGIRQARRIAGSLSQLSFMEILTSPLERAVETAECLASFAKCPVVHSPAFHECDFGEWTGLEFSSLELIPAWARFNSMRSLFAAPGGESLFDVQYRAVAAIRQLIQGSLELDRVVVTHADVIRAVLCFFLASPLDLHLRYSLHPASFTVVEVGEHAVRVAGINLPAIP
jgi:broad specificity phosphatase PhoE